MFFDDISDQAMAWPMAEHERGMLHDLINVLLEKLNTQRRLNEDLTRRLECERERIKLLEAAAYGYF